MKETYAISITLARNNIREDIHIVNEYDKESAENVIKTLCGKLNEMRYDSKYVYLYGNVFMPADVVKIGMFKTYIDHPSEIPVECKREPEVIILDEIGSDDKNEQKNEIVIDLISSDGDDEGCTE